MTDCNPTILKAELESLSVINERLNCEIGNLKIELETLRQENSRLREVMIEGMALCKEKDVEIHQLREDWEVMGEDLENASRENNRLREALEKISAYRLGGVKITTSHIAEKALNPTKS